MTPELIVFGPVPSRRLGRSLGINNIPPKACSYSCAYCQVGTTLHRETSPRNFYSPAMIVEAVGRRVEAMVAQGERIDYLTLVPDGEPTLDIQLAATIEQLKTFGIPVAVISNGSLSWQASVRQALAEADWVSMKVDSVDEDRWRHINRPHPSLDLPTILHGIRRFSQDYRGTLVTETMLVREVNDDLDGVARTAEFIAEIAPQTAYLAVPTRPPAVQGVTPPSESRIVEAYEVFRARFGKVQCLLEYEGTDFTSVGSSEDDLLSIIAVHPMREDALSRYLQRVGKTWSMVDELLRVGKIAECEYRGHRYFVMRLPPHVPVEPADQGSRPQ